MKLPTDVARNHTPIISEATRAGARRVMADRPTGLRQSSPIVANRYESISQIQPTLFPPAAIDAAGTMITNDSEANSKPTANFAGLDGLRVPSFTQIHANTGESNTIHPEFTDCHDPEVNVIPRITLRVLRSAKSVSVDAACSNTDQNTAAREEEDRDGDQAIAFVSRPRAAQEQPGKERDNGERKDVLERRRDPVRSDRDGARRIEADQHDEDANRQQHALPEGRLGGVHVVLPGDCRRAPGVRRVHFASIRYQTSPKNIPTAAAPNPQCHEFSGEIPQATSRALNESLCARPDVTSGAIIAPRLIPM